MSETPWAKYWRVVETEIAPMEAKAQVLRQMALNELYAARKTCTHTEWTKGEGSPVDVCKNCGTMKI